MVLMSTFACLEVGAAANRYRFNGIEHLEEIGLDLAAFRSYDAVSLDMSMVTIFILSTILISTSQHMQSTSDFQALEVRQGQELMEGGIQAIQLKKPQIF